MPIRFRPARVADALASPARTSLAVSGPSEEGFAVSADVNGCASGVVDEERDVSLLSDDELDSR